MTGGKDEREGGESDGKIGRHGKKKNGAGKKGFWRRLPLGSRLTIGKR